jgi:hypothetical protein
MEDPKHNAQSVSRAVYISILVVVVLALIGAVAWYGYVANHQMVSPSPSSGLSQAEEIKNAPVVDIHSMEVGSLPQGWPADFPLMGKTNIVQSYNQQSPSAQNKVEAVVTFASKQSVAAVCDAYGNWGVQNGWIVVTNGDTYGCHNTAGLLLLRKRDSSGTQEMQLTMRPANSTQSLVSAYYTSK